MRIVLIFLLSCLSFSGYTQVLINFQSDSLNNRIYTNKEVDTKPSFPGGDMALFRSLRIKYPADAREGGISGTVIISVVVEKDGTITHHALHQRLWPSIDAEALRVALTIPNGWTPATLNNENVRCRYQLPFKFILP